MIFNEMNNITVSHENVQESPHELGIGGALMHVYENECNYNALMKAAALSEMKYYNETGGDLFVQEAGALSGFMGKVKEFFKKVIEKIKSIAKKFVAKINQFTMKDKDFVKKYQNELIRRDLKDFEFNGYKFPLKSRNKGIALFADVKADGSNDQDAINDIIEKNRGSIVGESALTESEYRDRLKEMLYGEKEDFSVNIREQLVIISETSKNIKDVEKEEKDIIGNIDKIISGFEKKIKQLDTEARNLLSANKDGSKDGEAKLKDERIKGLNNEITVAKAHSNDLTVYFGACARAFADRNRQAKAICVKALSYKHESAMVSEGSYGDIFAGVEIV